MASVKQRLECLEGWLRYHDPKPKKKQKKNRKKQKI